MCQGTQLSSSQTFRWSHASSYWPPHLAFVAPTMANCNVLHAVQGTRAWRFFSVPFSCLDGDPSMNTNLYMQ